MGNASPKQALFAVALVGLIGPILSFLHIKDLQTSYSIIISALISIVGFFATKHSIPLIKRRTLRAGLCGRDINKKGSKEGEKDVPESLGLAPGVIFLVCLILFEQLHYYDVTTFVHSLTQGRFDFQLQGASDAWLVDYNAALATICFMLFLGFADDVLDIPWRVKLLLPCLASLPLLAAYSGGTGIQVPKPLVAFLHIPGYVELGILYKIYMIALVIFCANSINILAGINGLEAGQTFIIACAVLLHNFLQLGGASGTIPEVRDGHLFSAYLMLPLISTTLGLLMFNWYPSQVFVGDTFTYFAGMTLSVAGILGHFSETLLLFFVPQIINFVYSVPQLFKWKPCPRHRLPRYDPSTGLLHATDNMNLVNLFLKIFGPKTEMMLCVYILCFQVVCCGFGFVLRFLLAGIYK